MVPAPSGEIDLLPLFMAYNFGCVRVLIYRGHVKSRKVIDVSSLTFDLRRERLSAVCMLFHAITNFIYKGKKDPSVHCTATIG